MTPRPIHRRITFWLGLTILIFLTWAWHHSYWHGSGIRWGNEKKSLNLTSIFGVVQVRHVQVRPGTIPSMRFGHKGFTPFHQTSSQWHPWRPSPLPIHYRRETGSGDPYITPPLPPWIGHNLTIRWWLITLLHLIAWTAILTSLHRRQSRLLEKHTHPQP